jgi:hypothetical protein
MPRCAHSHPPSVSMRSSACMASFARTSTRPEASRDAIRLLQARRLESTSSPPCTRGRCVSSPTRPSCLKHCITALHAYVLGKATAPGATCNMYQCAPRALSGTVQGWQTYSEHPGHMVELTCSLDSCDASQFDALIIPGKTATQRNGWECMGCERRQIHLMRPHQLPGSHLVAHVLTLVCLWSRRREGPGVLAHCAACGRCCEALHGRGKAGGS